MRAKKVDGNHSEVVTALRDAGIRVFDTSGVGRGYPDLHCSFRGYSALVEVKSRTGELNPGQHKFCSEWEGPVIMARSGKEAVEKFFQGYAVGVLTKPLKGGE